MSVQNVKTFFTKGFPKGLINRVKTAVDMTSSSSGGLRTSNFPNPL